MDTISPSSSSSSTHQWKYHVFLSFRGEDTRNNFTDHLYAALKQKGIYTFRDDEKLERGKRISELFQAIEDSLFTIVVLSKNYASSTWCLDELVKIMNCEKKMGQIVLPIFYDVEPSVVRKRTGTYAKAFVEHEKRFSKNLKKVHAWRAALTDVTNISGWSLGDRPESEFIQDIIKVISHKLSSLFPKDTNNLVGIDTRVENLVSLLALGSSNVRIIGIWGMGGIGKTTLARVVYDKIFKEFDGGCFIFDVRGESEKHGLASLQQKLILEILAESVNIRDVWDGCCMIENRLCHEKVLLVVDNVNQFDQLKMLVGDPKWFGQGSRVIITTRDEHLLTRHKVHGIYEAQGFTDYEALQLFSLKSLNKYYPPEHYLDLSKSFVDYAKGLPLAIDVLGAFLYNSGEKEWKSALAMLKEYPKEEIIKVLEISFDGLEEPQKEIFLHIACFFNMKEKGYIVEILDCLGLYPESGLKVLIDRSLLKERGNKYWMHDMLRIMGQDRVRRGVRGEPGKWRRLWLPKDIRNVLMKNVEMEAIQGIVLELGELHKSEKAHWNFEAISKMPNLQLLMIHDVQLQHGPKHLPNNLRLLDWSGYPSKSLPSNFEPQELVGLHLLDSKIVRLWKDIKDLNNLKLVKLNNSLDLIATPDFTRAPNLEKLVLNGCIKLHEVHPSIMVLKRLTLLDLENCKSLRRLPSKIETESLEIFILSGCSKIKRIPEFSRNMKRLSKLHLNSTAITELPSSVEHLTKLASLHLRDCKNLECLPSIICRFESLEDIDFGGCSKLDGLNLMPRRSPNPVVSVLPSLLSMSSLIKLDLSNCNLQTFPNDIGNLSSLTNLYLSGNHFSCLPDSIVQLSKLLEINLCNCTRLRSLPQLPSRINLVRADDCTSLEAFPIAQDFIDCQYLHSTQLYFFNCFKLANNHGGSDMFLMRMLLSFHQEICKQCIEFRPFCIVFPGCKISKWLSHQSVGDRVIAQVTNPNKNVPSRSSNMWIGIALCVVFSPATVHNPRSGYWLTCDIVINKRKCSNIYLGRCPKVVGTKSSHLLMSYVPSQFLNVSDREIFNQIDENVFLNMEVRFIWRFYADAKIKNCGFRIVYEQDINGVKEMISAQSSNSTCITPYEGLDVRHDFDNSTEGINLKRSRDEYDGAGPSGEGCSNDVPHSRRIQIYRKDVWLMVALTMVTLIAGFLIKVFQD